MGLARIEGAADTGIRNGHLLIPGLPISWSLAEQAFNIKYDLKSSVRLSFGIDR